MTFNADTGYPNRLGGSDDIGLGELTGVLYGRSIVSVTFQEGHLVLKLEAYELYRVSGNARSMQVDWHAD
jgi:hypothetical protein